MEPWVFFEEYHAADMARKQEAFMLIREMEKSDRTHLERFYQEMDPQSNALFNPSNCNYHHTMAFFEGKKQNIRYFVAMEEDELLGYVFLLSYDSLIPSLGIAVAADAKGKGVGYALMKHAEEYAMAHGKGGITLVTHVANLRGQALYAKCGYERVGIHGASGQIFYMKRFQDPNFC